MIEEIVKKTSSLDAFLVLIAALAIVSFWRGVWGMMDLYLFPKNHLLSSAISIFIGLLVLVIVGLYRGGRKKGKK